MELYHRILIPTDGSDYTRTATTHGLWLAKMSGADVTALFVVDDAIFMNQTWGQMLPSGSPDLTYVLEDEGKKAVGAVRQEGEKMKVKVTPKVEHGNPAHVIIEMSRDFDLIVVGNLGRSGISKLLMGSVSEKVVRFAECPVLVVRNPKMHLPA
jgi:nucleotide-binding universal stress UspA family protein